MCHRERELRGFVYDRFIVESDSVQLMCIESRHKEGLIFAQRADLGVDDGDDLMDTVVNCDLDSPVRTGSSRDSRNVEILEFVYTVICQMEEDLMVENSDKLTMFLEDKTDMAGAETKPNEVDMECAQTYGSVLCEPVKAPRVETPTVFTLDARLRRRARCVGRKCAQLE